MVLALLLLCAGDPVEIGVHRTPGKPAAYYVDNKPAEEIVAKKDGEKILLCVRVNIHRNPLQGYTEKTAPLTAEEWKSILDLVAREKLLDWAPKEEEGQVADWGSSGFRIKGDKENAPTWTRPIRNGDPPAALSKRLAALAKEKVKDLPLHYFAS